MTTWKWHERSNTLPPMAGRNSITAVDTGDGNWENRWFSKTFSLVDASVSMFLLTESVVSRCGLVNRTHPKARNKVHWLVWVFYVSWMCLGLQANSSQEMPSPRPNKGPSSSFGKQKSTIPPAARHQVCSHPSVTRLSFCAPQRISPEAVGVIPKESKNLLENDVLFGCSKRSSKALSFCISSAEDGSSCRGPWYRWHCSVVACEPSWDPETALQVATEADSVLNLEGQWCYDKCLFQLVSLKSKLGKRMG